MTFAAGKVGQAFRFDGVDDKIMIANEAAFDFTTQVSTDAWVFISSGDGNYQSVVNKGYYSGGPFELRMTREVDPFPALLGCLGEHVIFFAVTTTNGLQNAGACITKGVWHHVAGIYDGTAVRVYLDGQIALSPNGTPGEVAHSGTLIQNNLSISIGWNGAFGEVWSGLIDEVEIFNRALDATEIQALFNAGSAGKCLTPPDSDGDSVPDSLDRCPDTSIPENVPTVRLGVNRFALVDADTTFDTRAPNGKGPQKSFTIEDTAGCSCEQIIAALGLGKGHAKFGCSISAMEEWVDMVNP